MDDKYLCCKGIAPKRIPHTEHWSCPDAETYLTGIDYYEHPKLCRERLKELYPQLELGIPAEDKPIPRPVDNPSSEGEEGGHNVRWGDGVSWQWDWGKNFKTAEEALKFSPLEQADFTNIPVVESRDYSSEEKIYESYKGWYSDDKAPDGKFACIGFYNTMFMWPLLTFGWEIFLEICLDDRFERIMDEFAEINRRVFKAFARLPINFVICHDDIVNARGPVCSPKWMHKYIFPRYEEFWSILKEAGKEPIFIVDGNMDAYVDDVFACGAIGIITEPYTDFKAIARKHENCLIAGEGDNRVLNRNNPAEIRAMVDSMIETSKMTNGYMMCVGNHIPWNTPPEAIKVYLDYATEKTLR